jgi:ribosomal-protein-alanine N-acetyltransferase
MLLPDFSIFPELETKRLILKEIIPDHASDFFNLRSNPEVMKFLDRPMAKSIDEIYTLIQLIQDRKVSGDGIAWGIFDKNLPHHKIGNIGFHNIIKEHYRAEIGYILKPHFHRKGIMFEAMNRVIDFGFRTLKLHSIEANINPNNTASKNLLIKSGFIREAFFRENYYYNGQFLNSEIYSLLNTQ